MLVRLRKQMLSYLEEMPNNFPRTHYLRKY